MGRVIVYRGYLTPRYQIANNTSQKAAKLLKGKFFLTTFNLKVRFKDALNKR